MFEFKCLPFKFEHLLTSIKKDYNNQTNEKIYLKNLDALINHSIQVQEPDVLLLHGKK